MNYALVKNGTVVVASHNVGALSRYIRNTDGLSISFPDDPSGVSIADYSVYPVNVLNDPVPTGQAPTGQFSYTVNGGVVERREINRPMTPAEIADEAAATTRQEELRQARNDARADAFVRQFVDMNPGQVTAYVNSNISNLADAKQLMTKMLLMMLSIAKEQYK